jgi:uncharacterized protein (DUF1778 family)
MSIQKLNIMNKDEIIALRVSKEEKKVISEKAKSFEMKVSDYIRFVAMNTKEIKKEETATQ